MDEASRIDMLNPDQITQRVRNAIEDLLALTEPQEQMARLEQEQLLTAEGLAALLDEAEHLAGVDPDQSYQIAWLGERASTAEQVEILIPRAAYLRAQIHAIRGEFERAQNLIERARIGYENLGLSLESLRTTVGLMRVLGETGNYTAALDRGQSALGRIDEALTAVDDPSGYGMVAAKLLHNCGFCYEQIGRYDDALTAYAAAESRYQALGMTEQEAHIVENRGAVLMALGRVGDALAAFDYAQQIYEEQGLDFYQAQTLINSGEAHLLLGNYMQSLQIFERAARLFDSLGNAVDRQILLRQMGDAYLSLNLHAEALDAYSRARSGLQVTGLTLHYALTLWGIGVVQIARDHLPEAQDALTEAAEIFRQLDNRPLRSALLLEQSRLLEITEGITAARNLAQQALAQVADSNWTVQKIYAYLRNADLSLPDTSLAEPLLVAAQQLVDTLELPQLRYRLQQRWGHLRLLQGDDIAAQAHLEAAINEIERLRGTLVQERLRASFLEDKTTAYQDLMQLYISRGDMESIRAAFAVAERAKSRVLVDLMAGAIQSKLEIAGDNEIVLQLQTLERELNVIYNEILGSGDETLRGAGAIPLKARATELERAINHLRLRHSLAQGERALSPAEQGLAVDPGLPEEMALLVYHAIGDEILAFLWHEGELHLLRRLSTLSQVQQRLQRLTVHWARLRIDHPFLNRHWSQLERSAQRILHEFYVDLMEPVIALFERMSPAHPVGKLAIVPHGLLHQLPFQALYDGQRYLLERCAISYAPSATVLALCQHRTLRRDGLALAVAAPDARIPAAAHEARQVARHLGRHFPDVRLLLNEEATLVSVTALASRCSRLHLACHGLFRSDNPLFSALKLHDGWLTAVNVSQLDLTGALITLSACESGRSQVVGGDEILGLVYAFLSAGAASLLVSQWLVQDEVTAQFMDQWYTELATATDLSEALRAAQLTMMTQYSHPYHWAPFVLVGQCQVPTGNGYG